MSDRPYVGIVGPLGPAQLACLRSWRRAGLRTAFFQTGGRPLHGFLSRLADFYRFLPESGASKESIARVGKECTAHRIAAITALSEQLALKLWSHRQEGGFPMTGLMLNEPGLYGALESKLKQVGIAEQADLPVLPTIPLAAVRDSDKLPADRLMVLRPDIARLVRPMFKAEIIGNRSDAEKFLASRSLDEAWIIAQPFVAGPNLVVHAARATDGSWDHHEAYVTEIKFNGLAVSLKPYLLSAELIEACRKFEKATGLHGVFHYDFIIDEDTGKAFFLEVNPRLGGTTAKVYAAGYDEPTLLVAAHLPSLLASDFRQQTKRHRAISRIAALKCVLAAIHRPLSSIDFPTNSRAAVFGPALRGMLTYPDEVFSLSDILGNLAYLRQAGA